MIANRTLSEYQQIVLDLLHHLRISPLSPRGQNLLAQGFPARDPQAPHDYVRIIRGLLAELSEFSYLDLQDNEPPCVREARSVIDQTDPPAISEAQRAVIERYARTLNANPQGVSQFHIDSAKGLCLRLVYALGPTITWAQFLNALRDRLRGMSDEDLANHYFASKLLSPQRSPASR